MKTGAIVAIGAGVAALLYFGSKGDESSAGAGGAGVPFPASDEGISGAPTDPLGGFGDALRDFLTPATAPSTDLTVADSKKASSVQSYTAASGQEVNSANFSSLALGGPAYASPTGEVFAANFSSAITGGAAYAAPPSSGGSSKKAANASYASFSPAIASYAPASAPAQNFSSAANFSSVSGQSVYVAPPKTQSFSSAAPVSTVSSGGGSSSSVGNSKKAASSTPAASSSSSSGGSYKSWTGATSYNPKPSLSSKPSTKPKPKPKGAK